MESPEILIDVYLSYPFRKVHTSLEVVVMHLKDMLKKHHETWLHMESSLKYTPNAIESSRLIVFCLTEGYIKTARLKRELRLAIQAKKPILYLMFEDGDTKALDRIFETTSDKPFSLKVPQAARRDWEGPFKETVLKKINDILSSHKPESIKLATEDVSEDESDDDEDDAQLSTGEENDEKEQENDLNNNLEAKMEKQLVLDENKNLIKDIPFKSKTFRSVGFVRNPAKIVDIAFHKNNGLASCNADGNVRLWSLNTFKWKKDLKWHAYKLFMLNEERMLVAVGDKGKNKEITFGLRTYDFNLKDSTGMIVTSGQIQAFAKFNDNHLVWSESVPTARSSEYFIQYCDVELLIQNQKFLNWFIKPTVRVATSWLMKCLQPLPGGFLAGCGDMHKINIYASDGQHVKMLEGHTESISGLRVTSKGNLMSSGVDHSFRIWDFESGECLKKIDLTEGFYEAMVPMPGFQFACKLYEGSAIRIYDSDLEVLCEIGAERIHKSTKRSEILIHLEEDRFASACGSTVRIFDFQKRPKNEKPPHLEWLTHFDVSTGHKNVLNRLKSNLKK